MRIKQLLFCLALAWTLTGCVTLFDDSGATQRAQIYADGRVQVETQRRLAEEARAHAVEVEAQERTDRAGNLPTLALIVAVAVCAAVWLNWHGKISHVQAVAHAKFVYGLNSDRYKLPILEELARQEYNQGRQIPAAVQLAADQRGGLAVWQDGRWTIVDTSGRIIARQKQIGVSNA